MQDQYNRESSFLAHIVEHFLPSLTGAELKLLLVMTRQDPEQSQSVSISDFARRTGLHHETIVLTLRHLAKLGLIEAHRHSDPETGAHLTSTYTLKLPPLVAVKPRARYVKRPSFSATKRLRIFARDRYACRVCGSQLDLTVDHIVAFAQGGSNDESNLQTLCRACNTRKGTK